jgi:antitoxin VapB
VNAVTSVTKLFLSNRSQAVRIPSHLRLPDSVEAVEVRACGHERIISPVGQRWDSFFHAPHAVPDDFMVERATQEQAARESL